MGWKTFKTKFGIQHLVHIQGNTLLIGSPYVSDIVKIDMSTGEIKESSTFSGFLRDNYPELKDASKEDILSVLQEKDTFSEDSPVFTYSGSKIIEKLCEEHGWPNLTHDGELMYDNSHFPTRKEAIEKALDNANAGIEITSRTIKQQEERLKESREHLEDLKKEKLELMSLKNN